jgi:type II secretion system protein D
MSILVAEFRLRQRYVSFKEEAMRKLKTAAARALLLSMALASNTATFGQSGGIPTTVAMPNAVPGVQMSIPNVVPTNESTSIQIYNVPSEMVGVVGARLRVLYKEPTNITTEPGTGRLMVMATPAIHREIASRIELLQREVQTSGAVATQTDAGTATLQRQYQLNNITARDLEESLQKIGGPRMTVTTGGNGEVAQFRLAGASGVQDILQIDRRSNTVVLQGPSSNVYSWLQVVGAVDQPSPNRELRPQIIPLAPADPKKVEQALQLVRTVAYRQQVQEEQSTGAAAIGPRGAARADEKTAAGNATNAEKASAIGTLETLDSESGLFGDVQIEFVNELGLVIVKGGKKDVQRVLEVIDQIKKQSEGTQPEVEVVPLKHVDSQALETIAKELYEEVLSQRQGPLSIKALVQPNALLLVGRRESIDSLKELVNKLDQPLDESSQLKVYKLLHTSSVDAEELVRSFFVESPGGSNDARAGLGTRVRVISDYRTNALVVQASPRDHLEVARLISEIDVETTPAQNEIRVFPLKYALATDLQPILQAAINGEALQGGQQGNQGGGGGGNAGAGSDRATPHTSNLSIVSRGKKTDSGILAGIVVTSNPSINSLLVRAPAKSMDLIATLIAELDKPPSAESQLKVFEVKHGDATQLALLVQQLFGLPATAGTSTTGGVFGNNAGQTGLGSSQSGIVPLRVSVDTRTNSIIASGAAVDLEVLEVLLLRLDEAGVESRTTEVIWLRNSSANNVATAITQLLSSQRQIYQQSILLGQAVSAFEQIDREVIVVPEVTTNSLIVSATPRYFQRVKQVIESLDRRPPMIMVQILLAEVTLGDTFEFGAELGLQDSLLFDRNSATGGTLDSPGFNVAGASVAATGTSTFTQPLASNSFNPLSRGRPEQLAGQGIAGFGLGRTNSTLGYGGMVLSAANESVNILIRALQDANRLQILSRPQVMTLDTVAAFVQVGAQVPRITGVTGGTTVAGQTVSTQDVPVGLIMRVQPRTNQDGLILMDVQVERSTVGDEATGIPVGFSATGQVIRSPIINTTRAETRVSAYDGQTVVFAGLISKQRSSRSRRVPYLADIPVVGNLFKFDTEAETRSELLVVMTPRIVRDQEDIDMINQLESARMSWCLADVVNMHGVSGLSEGNGLWGPSCAPIIYPDVSPTIDTNAPMNGIQLNPGEMLLQDGMSIEPTPTPPSAIPIQPVTTFIEPVPLSLLQTSNVEPSAYRAPINAPPSISTASNSKPSDLPSTQFMR